MTLVLKKHKDIPDIITAGKDTVAVRVPNHPVTITLLNQLPFPLAAPSANPFNNISPTKPAHVERYFKNDIKINNHYLKADIFIPESFTVFDLSTGAKISFSKVSSSGLYNLNNNDSQIINNQILSLIHI